MRTKKPKASAAPKVPERAEKMNSGLRLPVTLVRRVDEEVARVNGATPGANANRTSIMIAALEAYLLPREEAP